MDLLGSLLTAHRCNDYILVVLYRFNMMAILITCQMTILATQVAKLFFTHVWAHFVYLLP